MQLQVGSLRLGSLAIGSKEIISWAGIHGKSIHAKSECVARRHSLAEKVPSTCSYDKPACGFRRTNLTEDVIFESSSEVGATRKHVSTTTVRQSIEPLHNVNLDPTCSKHVFRGSSHKYQGR